MPILDGIASLLIGVILAITALLLAYECRSLLLGESADSDVVQAIRTLVSGDRAVERVGRILTMYLGPDEMLVIINADFEDALRAPEIESAVQRLEDAVRQRYPVARRIFIEPSRQRHSRTNSS
jgi:divalent metal cation (Fe/Co/Zn/Cd) transporter